MNRSPWPAVTVALASLTLALAAVVLALMFSTVADPAPSTVPAVMPHSGATR